MAANKYWVKGLIAQRYTRDGLVPFVANQSEKRHQHILKELGVAAGTQRTCSLCTRDNLLPEHSPQKCPLKQSGTRCYCKMPIGRRKCPHNICSRFYDLIIRDSILSNIAWSNTDPTKWCSDYWEYAKCYINIKGYKDVKSAAECDMNGLLKLCTNNYAIGAEIDCPGTFVKCIGTTDLIYLCTKDYDVEDVIDRMIAVLEDKCLVGISDATKAVQRLIELKRRDYVVSEKEIAGEEEKALAEIGYMGIKTSEVLKSKTLEILNRESQTVKTSNSDSVSGEEEYDSNMRRTTRPFRKLLGQNLKPDAELLSDSGITDSVSKSTPYPDDEISLVEESITPPSKIEEGHEDDTDKPKDSIKEGLLHAVDDTMKSVLDGTELNKLCSIEGRTSSNVKKECDKICAAIKAESDQIVHVFSAYKLYDEASIVFVVFAEKEILLDLPWTLELRVVHQYSEESEIVMYCKDNSRLSTESSRTIEDVIDKYSVKLMHNHTYLSAISASSVVSKHYGTTHHNIVSEPCIVLSVLVKHFIPLNEELFPTKLDGITVDVREGGVRFCGSSADDFHDQVRMGCKITSSFLPQKFGTLGGFVEHPEYGLCGFTCAHAILNDEKKLEVKGKGNVNGKELGLCEIFQPLCAPQNKIGRVVEVTYKEGNDGKTGIDVALFKIEQRPPAEGNFPDSQGTTTQVKFESGRVWGKDGIPTHQPMVQKFGFVTGLTSGQIQFDGAVVKEILFHSKMETGTLDLTTTLYKQYHIKSNDRNVRFSELGDSGALVFMSDGFDQEDDLRCIGMVEGIWNDNTCAVTPITAILEELKVTQLKSFTPIVTWKKIDARLSEMEERIMRAIAQGNGNA